MPYTQSTPEISGARAPEQAPNRTGLPDGLKAKMEGAFGTRLDHIRVNKNSGFPAKVGAIATTQGHRIDFAPGQYNPHSAQGQKLIGHEAWHTVQQAQGRVKPTLQMKTGHLVNDSDVLEAEADRMGEILSTSTQNLVQKKTAHDRNCGCSSCKVRVEYPGGTLQRYTDTSTPIQRIKSNYEVVLPPTERFRLIGLERNDHFDQNEVDAMVDDMKRPQMDFYPDTMDLLLANANYNRANVDNPFGSIAPVTLWQCPNCYQPTTYQGIDIGHIVNWKDELKKAGVQNLNEAKIVYNNLKNLRIECRSCNVSHAWEVDASQNFRDLPTQTDFIESRDSNTTIAKAKERYQVFMNGYSGVNLDEYEESGIDDSDVEVEEAKENIEFARSFFPTGASASVALPATDLPSHDAMHPVHILSPRHRDRGRHHQRDRDRHRSRSRSRTRHRSRSRSRSRSRRRSDRQIE